MRGPTQIDGAENMRRGEPGQLVSAPSRDVARSTGRDEAGRQGAAQYRPSPAGGSLRSWWSWWSPHPARWARATAASEVCTPSLARIFCVWVRTVFAEI